MDALPSFLAAHWHVIAASPGLFIVYGFICAGVGYVVARTILLGTLEANRERLEHAKEALARAAGEKSELLKKLEANGADVEELKKQFGALPRFHVSDKPPPDPKEGVLREGDFWIQVDKDGS